jgi:uncharacterized protein YjiS (DUF1127 family)
LGSLLPFAVAIGRLDDRLLSDIGIVRELAEREAQKPFWRS